MTFHKALFRGSGSENTKDRQEISSKAKAVSIAILVALISLLYYSTKLVEHRYSVVYQELYYVPLILAGLWFGLRGALVTCVSIVIVYFPFIAISWSGFSQNDSARIAEIVHYFMVAFILGIFRERELAEQKRVRRVERLAAMGEAISGVAHDMKTPVIAIGGFARLLRTKAQKAGSEERALMGLAREMEEKLPIIIKEAGRMENMIKDMLDFARPLELQRSGENVHDAVEEVLSLVRNAAEERKVRVVSSVSETIEPVSWDGMRMRRVLLNLLMNAIQSSPEGETVTLHCRQNADKLIIDVTDCGCGIPRDKRGDVFVPFYTTKKEGTGLGLPVVKMIVEAHVGTVRIMDNPVRGLTFRVTIPLIDTGGRHDAK